MKKKLILLSGVYMMVIIILPIFISIDSNLIFRLILISTSIYIILITYLIKYENRFDLISSLSYKGKLVSEEEKKAYMNHAFISSAVLLGPFIFFSASMQFLRISYWIDFIVLLIQVILWGVQIYSFPSKYRAKI